MENELARYRTCQSCLSRDSQHELRPQFMFWLKIIMKKIVVVCCRDKLNCQIFLTLGWHQASSLETWSCLFVSESLAAIECSWAGCLFNSRMVMKSLRQHHGEQKMGEFQFLHELSLCFIDPRSLDKGQMLSEGELYYCQIWKIC